MYHPSTHASVCLSIHSSMKTYMLGWKLWIFTKILSTIVLQYMYAFFVSDKSNHRTTEGVQHHPPPLGEVSVHPSPPLSDFHDPPSKKKMLDWGGTLLNGTALMKIYSSLASLLKHECSISLWLEQYLRSKG